MRIYVLSVPPLQLFWMLGVLGKSRRQTKYIMLRYKVSYR